MQNSCKFQRKRKTDLHFGINLWRHPSAKKCISIITREPLIILARLYERKKKLLTCDCMQKLSRLEKLKEITGQRTKIKGKKNKSSDDEE